MTTVLGPLRSVAAAFDAGVTTRQAVAERTGLTRDVVDAAVDHLLRVGSLTTTALTAGCPQEGCGGCPIVNGSCAAAPGNPDKRLALVPR